MKTYLFSHGLYLNTTVEGLCVPYLHLIYLISLCGSVVVPKIMLSSQGNIYTTLPES